MSGWQKLRLNPDARGVMQMGGMKLDFSGIAKGHAVDRVSDRLTAMGATSHLIEIGGELKGRGVKPDAQPWWVEIERVEDSPAPRTVAALFDLAVATSGDYRRAFVHDGRLYPHTLDGSTGRPVNSNLTSVTVLHASAMMADAYATALTVMGPFDGPDYAEAAGLAAHFVERTERGPVERMTPAFAAMMDDPDGDRPGGDSRSAALAVGGRGGCALAGPDRRDGLARTARGGPGPRPFRRHGRGRIRGGGSPILVAFASQTGFAEELAWMTARALGDGGVGARVLSFADLDTETLKAADRALLIVSTTGEGDPPDAAARFVRKTMTAEADLASLRFGVLALGDRSYDQFCGFGHAVDGWLRRAGAEPLFDMVEVDNGEAGAIRHWQHQLNQITGSVTAPDWTPPAYDPWRLVERTLVNPGSPGGEAWHLAFEAAGETPVWSAGDIAEVGLPERDGATPGSREYSIASLPSDGRVEFLIRLMRHPDGTPGLASGWLTQGLALGGEIGMRLRPNRSFHGPDDATPMILIGNGTGIGGPAGASEGAYGGGRGLAAIRGTDAGARRLFRCGASGVAGVGRAATAGPELLARRRRRALCAGSGRSGGRRPARLGRARGGDLCLRQSGRHVPRRSCGAGKGARRGGGAGDAGRRTLSARRVLKRPAVASS